jgi:5-methylcytosine-specific restriction endonuclease McrA
VDLCGDTPHRRVIPNAVKFEVWKRDGGECVKCRVTDELHFDHIISYSKGGTLLTPDNIQLLCARHNIKKSNKIE